MDNTTIDTGSEITVGAGAEMGGEPGYQAPEVTTMTTETTAPAAETTQAAPAAKAPKAKKAPKEKRPYPFKTKAQIREEIAHYPAACEAMVILLNRQTSFEQATRTTRSLNRRGFMSSHAVHGTRIAELILQGAELSPEDQERVFAISSRYTKQLAEHARDLALEADPTLAARSACFFSGQ